MSDSKWLYYNGTTQAWYLEGQQPSGYTKYYYGDQATVAKTSTVNNDIVYMYAQWKIFLITKKSVLGY